MLIRSPLYVMRSVPSTQCKQVLAMAMTKLLLCALAVVVATSGMQAAEAQAPCGLTDLELCYGAVSEPNQVPSAECCAKVAVVDLPCFCKALQTATYPKVFIDRALHVPQLCGGAAYKHFQGKNCAGYVIA